MKKTFTLLALAMMAGMPLFAQDVADGPIRTDKDAKEIFTQDFEADWDVWSSTPVDTIDKVNYYKSTGTAQTGINIYDGSEDWKIYGARDTMLILMNGVMTSDDAADIESNAFGEDSYTIVLDDDNQHRSALEKFGVDGGNYYFRYQAGLANSPNGSTAYSNGVTANYRRNLFVRGLPIEDETSYRLTLYVKAKEYGQTAPKFYADVMRGYFHSEKPFSMGIKSDEKNYMYNNTFEYEKSEFSGEWEKVTFMTYYLNDSIADQFVFSNGYWWTDTEWEWEPEAGTKLHYIQQPDKFFVRLSFASDSTTFMVDNISLTKSWIGGVEHNKDLLRVDFGYETNMDDLAAKEKERTNIAAVSVPGEYFTVWGLDHETQEWWDIEIASAEYHDDGYMYMWTAPIEMDGQLYDNLFEGYDSVLVSFNNPVDSADLCLYYSGSKFPKALDVDWIKAGKLLPNFSNEISTENPHIGNGVYSKKNLPPVLQGLPYENGSFGLDGSVRELTLRLSRAIAYDNTGESSQLAFLRVTKSGVKEIWTVKEVTDSTATFERPASATGKLEGEYKFEFLQLRGAGLTSTSVVTDYGDPIIVNWEFGPFDLNPTVNTVLKTNWKEETTDTQAVPSSLAIWNGKDGFQMGTGTGNITKSRLFWTNPESGYECGFYVSGRAEGKDNGHLFYGLNEKEAPVTLQPGRYSISFAAVQWDQPCETKLYIYKNTFGDEPSKVKDLPVEDKTLIGTFTPAVKAPYSSIQIYNPPYGSWPAGYEQFSFVFNIEEAGNYVIEWDVKKNSTNGDMISDFEIATVAGISFPYVTKFNSSLAAAKEKLAAAAAGEDGKYLGQDYNMFSNVIDSYEGWQHTAPSAYNATVATLDKATADMQLRMDTVDLFGTTYNKVIDKLSEEALADYTALEAYKALEKLALDNEDYPFADNTTAQITDMIGQFNDGIAALDTRKGLIDKFVAEIAAMKALVEDSLASKGYDEYAVLEASYNENKDADLITPTNEEFQVMYDAICSAKANYVAKVDYVAAKTRQIRELLALATQLEYDFAAEIKETVEQLQDEDPALETIIREAAILQILKNFAAGNNLMDLDVSALMPNYFLYNEAQVGRDMELNSSNKWRLKYGFENTTAFPHWTFKGTSGSWIPTKVKVGAGDGFMDWEKEGRVFDGGLRCTPTTQGNVSTTVEGLPEAFYWVGFYGQNQTSNFALAAVSDSTSYNADYAVKTGKFNYKEFGQDSIMVAGNLTVSIDQKSSSSSEADLRYFILKLRGIVEGIDYAAAVEAQEAKLEELITFVSDVKAAGNVKYYGLDGVQMNAPKAGQIAIRKTVLENGKSVVEKVLVK